MSSKGKRAEKKIAKHLKTISKNPDWWVHRLPDAGQCMGRLQKQPADYIVMYQGSAMLIEVKEETRPNKLARSRLTQFPKMRLFEMAGGRSIFLIYHYNENLWRLFSASELSKRVVTPTIDLDEFVTLKNLTEVFFVIENLMRKQI